MQKRIRYCTTNALGNVVASGIIEYDDVAAPNARAALKTTAPVGANVRNVPDGTDIPPHGVVSVLPILV